MVRFERTLKKITIIIVIVAISFVSSDSEVRSGDRKFFQNIKKSAPRHNRSGKIGSSRNGLLNIIPFDNIGIGNLLNNLTSPKSDNIPNIFHFNKLLKNKSSQNYKSPKLPKSNKRRKNVVKDSRPPKKNIKGDKHNSDDNIRYDAKSRKDRNLGSHEKHTFGNQRPVVGTNKIKKRDLPRDITTPKSENSHAETTRFLKTNGKPTITTLHGNRPRVLGNRPKTRESISNIVSDLDTVRHPKNDRRLGGIIENIRGNGEPRVATRPIDGSRVLGNRPKTRETISNIANGKDVVSPPKNERRLGAIIGNIKGNSEPRVAMLPIDGSKFIENRPKTRGSISDTISNINVADYPKNEKRLEGLIKNIREHEESIVTMLPTAEPGVIRNLPKHQESILNIVSGIDVAGQSKNGKRVGGIIKHIRENKRPRIGGFSADKAENIKKLLKIKKLNARFADDINGLKQLAQNQMLAMINDNSVGGDKETTYTVGLNNRIAGNLPVVVVPYDEPSNNAIIMVSLLGGICMYDDGLYSHPADMLNLINNESIYITIHDGRIIEWTPENGSWKLWNYDSTGKMGSFSN